MNVEEYPGAARNCAEKDGLEIEAGLLIDMINETSYAVSGTRPGRR